MLKDLLIMKNKKNKILILLSLSFVSFLADANSVSQLALPNGFDIEIIAKDLNSPRQIAETENGHIIVGSKKGSEVIALVYQESSRTYEKLIVANGLENPAGVTIHEGNLYFAEMDTIWIVNQIDSWIESDSKSLPKKSIFMNDLPSETWHGLKYIDFGPDGSLYIPVGVPCNICLEPQTKDPRFAAIHKYVDGELIIVADAVSYTHLRANETDS